jgi:hypothetical protein
MSNAPSDKTGCLGLLLKVLGLTPSASESGAKSFPYRLRDDFLSPAESSFYHILLTLAGERLTVCPKVSLNDLFFVSRPDQNLGARNRISSKHVDFLLCESRSMQPRVGIELDDSSHAREDRQTRDALVEKVFEAAGLPLLRFPVQRAYTVSDIASRLLPYFDETAVPPRAPDLLAESAAPLCPKCNVPLVIRQSSRGPFYGCSNYPKCRETQSIG